MADTSDNPPAAADQPGSSFAKPVQVQVSTRDAETKLAALEVHLATWDRLTTFVVPGAGKDGADLVINDTGISLPTRDADKITALAARSGVQLVVSTPDPSEKD